MKTVAIVDYEMGNLRSVEQAVLHAAQGLSFSVIFARSAQDIRNADRVILPGQGAMRDCMQHLHDSGMQEAVLDAACDKPLFGVCVGMQMLLDASDEGNVTSLGLFPGRVRRFDLATIQQTNEVKEHYKIPHMGWNRVYQQHDAQGKPHALWQDIEDGAYFYFVHSYYAHPWQKAHSAGETVYGIRFTSAIARDNIFATQFHPEKSVKQGLQLYRNFLQWQP